MMEDSMNQSKVVMSDLNSSSLGGDAVPYNNVLGLQSSSTQTPVYNNVPGLQSSPFQATDPALTAVGVDTVKLCLMAPDYRIAPENQLTVKPPNAGAQWRDAALWQRGDGSIQTGSSAFYNYENLVHVDLTPTDGHTYPMLYVQFSLPKLAHGQSNLYPADPASIKPIMRRIQRVLAEAGILCDIMEAEISRLDLFRNIPMDHDFRSYAPVLKAIHPSYLQPSRQDQQTTVYWGFDNQSRSIIAYDKTQQMRDNGVTPPALPENLLRLEFRFKKAEKVRSSLGIATVADLIQQANSLESCYRQAMQNTLGKSSLEGVPPKAVTGEDLEAAYFESTGKRTWKSNLEKYRTRVDRLREFGNIEAAVEDELQGKDISPDNRSYLRRKYRDVQLIRSLCVPGNTARGVPSRFDLYAEFQAKAMRHTDQSDAQQDCSVQYEVETVIPQTLVDSEKAQTNTECLTTQRKETAAETAPSPLRDLHSETPDAPGVQGNRLPPGPPNHQPWRFTDARHRYTHDTRGFRLPWRVASNRIQTHPGRRFTGIPGGHSLADIPQGTGPLDHPQVRVTHPGKRRPAPPAGMVGAPQGTTVPGRDTLSIHQSQRDPPASDGKADWARIAGILGLSRERRSYRNAEQGTDARQFW